MSHKYYTFPLPIQPIFQPGDEAFVKLRSEKETGRAIILQPLNESNRYLVRYTHNNTTHDVNPTRLIPIYNTRPSIVLSYNTTDYRTLARSQIKPSDHVAEIGSSYGVCTDIISTSTKNIFGIEVSEDLIEEARRRYPELRFENINVLENKERGEVLMKGVNKVFVDIGGNRTAGDVFLVLEFLVERIRPALICVKSEELFDDAQRYRREIGKTDEGSGEIPAEWFTALRKKYRGHEGKIVQPWFRKAREEGFTRNPLRYPVRVTREGRAICRLHNYTQCKKIDICAYDHGHCHHCGEEGHRAVECPVGE